MQLVIFFFICFWVQLAFGSDDERDSDDDTYPDPHLTPGAIFSDVTIEDLCKGGYARKARDVSSELKRNIKASYGLDPYDPNYTIDHFIPLSLGGTNDPENLWPQKLTGIIYGSKQKASSDFYLFREVCDGRITLDEAREKIRMDWVRTYRECCSDVALRYQKKGKKKVRKKKSDLGYIEGELSLDHLRHRSVLSAKFSL